MRVERLDTVRITREESRPGYQTSCEHVEPVNGAADVARSTRRLYADSFAGNSFEMSGNS